MDPRLSESERCHKLVHARWLRCLLQVNVHQLADLTRLVRGESLSALSRRILAALITIDVHSRDIVGNLVSKNVSSTSDFEWQMQLRYYWEGEDLVVRQVSQHTGWRSDLLQLAEEGASESFVL